MYSFHIPKKKYNAEPWRISFEKRLRFLLLKNKKRKVVYITKEMDARFRYRVYNMCQALEYSTQWEGIFFTTEELRYLKKYLDRIDVIIFSRTWWSLKLDQFLFIAKKAKIPTVFDIDDLVFNVKMIPSLMNTLNVGFNEDAYTYWFSNVSRIYLMADKCNFIIATNLFLQKQLKKIFTTKVFLINNFLNKEQLHFSEQLYNIKKNSQSQRPFVIGYFSGSASHINDFKRVALSIYALMEKYSDITLEVTGYMEFPTFLEKYIQSERIKHFKFVDFLTLQKKIAKVDVNIMPLVNDVFTNCKSELKYFEASIVGTPSCATPVYVYRNNIKDGKTGFLCDEIDWFQTIERIYKGEIADDLTEQARLYCINKYSPEKQYKIIEEILNEISQ